MSVSDTLSDAVAELDGYIAEQAELLDVRDRMNKLREKIDGLYKDVS